MLSTTFRTFTSKPANILLLITILLFSFLFHYYDYIRTLQFLPVSVKMALRDADKTLLDLENFGFLINQRKICDDCDGNFLLIIAIISSALNRLERNDVRLMWGRASKCTKLVFIIGDSTNSSTNAQVMSENRRHGDIIQGNFAEHIYDSSSNKIIYDLSFSYKHLMVLKWARKYCSKARFVVKIDEAFVLYLLDNDVILDLAKFRLFLKRVMMEQEGIACRVLRNGTITNNLFNATSTQPADHENHLPYCWGGLVVYPADVIHQILSESHRLSPPDTDDVFVTGILAKRAGLKHLNFEPHFFLKSRDNDWMQQLQALFEMKISVKDFFDTVY